MTTPLWGALKFNRPSRQSALDLNLIGSVKSASVNDAAFHSIEHFLAGVHPEMDDRYILLLIEDETVRKYANSLLSESYAVKNTRLPLLCYHHDSD